MGIGGDAQCGISGLFVVFALGSVFGSLYPWAWVQQQPYVKAARALLDGCFLHRREAQELRVLTEAAVAYGGDVLMPVLAEVATTTPMPAWVATGAAVAMSCARRRRRP